MSARDLSKQIEIKTPCSADWDAMIGNDRVRFCEHCNLSVNDLTQLTPKRVRRLIVKSKGRLCVRYRRRPDGSPLIKAVPRQLHQIRTRVSRIAAAAFTGALSLSSAVAQSPTSNLNVERVFAYVQIGSDLLPAQFGARIVGKITDSNGTAIEGAGIILSASDMSYLSGAITNSAGDYSLEGLVPGRYWLSIEAPGFSKQETIYASLAENETLRVDRALQTESLAEEEQQHVLMGGVAIHIESPVEPLVAAAMEDDLQALEALLTRGNVNVRDKNRDSTALECAVHNGNREMVQVLLSAGAEVNSRNKSNQTVLMMLSDESTAEIVWDLINAGAKVNLKDDEGDTALIETASEKNLAVLTALLHAGAKVDAKNDKGQTALMLAASNDQLANVRALIRAGADMNARDKQGQTPLDYAIKEDHEKLIKLFQSYGAITGEKPNENGSEESP